MPKSFEKLGGQQPRSHFRSPEGLALFNAVLTSELLVNACWQKQQEGPAGLGWPAAFLILPLALHPGTRHSIPRDRRITLARWALRNPEIIADMDFRVMNMVEPTKRAIRHGLRVGRLGIDGTALIALARPKNPNPGWPEELRESVRAARFCGRWFNSVETHMAFELLGIGA